jgi:hypothetical protein
MKRGRQGGDDFFVDELRASFVRDYRWSVVN